MEDLAPRPCRLPVALPLVVDAVLPVPVEDVGVTPPP
jgi:hypothetical protein